MAPRMAGVRPPCTPRPRSRGRRLAGLTSTTTPPRRRTRELAATNAKFFTNEGKKTLEPASSVGERPAAERQKEEKPRGTGCREVRQRGLRQESPGGRPRQGGCRGRQQPGSGCCR